MMEGTSMLGRIEWYRERLERAEEKLAHLTTLQVAFEHDEKTKVLWWKRTIDGWYVPVEVCHYQPSSVCLWWTPIPAPKEAE